MKKLFITLLLSMALAIGFSQITPDFSYNYSGTFAKLSSSGNKFYLMDVGLSQCRIYNMNNTLWKTINLSVPSGNYLYDIKYLSEGLFTSDNSLSMAYVYYAYDATNAYYTFHDSIIRENGTELLSIPGCQYMEVINMENDGLKLVAYCYDYSVSPYTIQTKVYSLPGTLLATEKTEINSASRLPFPNPAIEYTTISYQLGNGTSTANMIIHDIQGKEIERFTINNNIDHITLPTGNYKSGMYFYTIESGNNKQDSGRFLVK